MRIDSYYHSIQNDFGTLLLISTAYNKRVDTYIDYMRTYEDGRRECRNLYLSCYGGYSITFPGAYSRTYYGDTFNGHYVKEPWTDCNCNHVGWEQRATDHSGDIHQILKKYPDFVYTLKKWRGERYYITRNLPDIFAALQIWTEHKEVEFMLANGLDSLVFSAGFWKQTEKKRRDFVRYVMQHKGLKNYSLRQIQNLIKYNMTLKEYKEYEAFKSSCYTAAMSVDCFRYMKKKGLSGYGDYKLYMDYRKLAKIAGHNLKEDYWNHPADLEKAHSKVLAEVNAIEAVKEAQKLVQLRIDNPGMFHNLDVISKRLSVFNANMNGYEIVVTSDLAEWQRQADTLHQCIIRCAYYKAVARREKVLVFIRKAGFPIATAEVLPQNRIGQFYADERSGTPNGSRPTADVIESFNKWLSDKPDLIEFTKAKRKSKKTELTEVA